MYHTVQKGLLCMVCYRDTPPEARHQCVDLETAYMQYSNKLDRALIVSLIL